MIQFLQDFCDDLPTELSSSKQKLDEVALAFIVEVLNQDYRDCVLRRWFTTLPLKAV